MLQNPVNIYCNQNISNWFDLSFASPNVFGSKKDTSTVWLWLSLLISEEQHFTAENKKMLFSYLTSFLLGLFLFSTAVGMFHRIALLSFITMIRNKYASFKLFEKKKWWSILRLILYFAIKSLYGTQCAGTKIAFISSWQQYCFSYQYSPYFSLSNAYSKSNRGRSFWRKRAKLFTKLEGSTWVRTTTTEEMNVFRLISDFLYLNR